MKRLLALFVVFGIVVGCAASAARFLAYETSEDYGYRPPTAEELKDRLYGNSGEDLKSVAPELWP